MKPNFDRIPAIKDYIENLFAKEDAPLIEVKKACQEANLPSIHVPPSVGKFLYLLVKIKKPLRILEIGTLGGYSAIWLAKGMPQEGKLFTIEINPDNANLAKKNVELAGFSSKIEIICDDALAVLTNGAKFLEEKFDLVFIDADKENYLTYLELIKPHLNPDALIISDNLIPKWKAIGHPHPKDMMAKAIYQYNDKLAESDDFITAVTTTIVGQDLRIDGLGISLYQP
jgi:predicted O-methyltransferase YrrM